jgi:serine/threonine-protein kinase PknG
MPTLAGSDPADAVLADPVVAEQKRFCANCASPVGRGRHGEPGLAEGFCGRCGTPFSFTPRLYRGQVIGGRYEVAGVLAHGGLGWIYLARDRQVDDRWVVLKGLIDVGDQVVTVAAANEVRVLTELDHPNIVRLLDVVEHTDPRSEKSVGYTVMEYVSGMSLRELALAHHRELGRAEPLPLGQVIAYGLEILSAMGYLHAKGLLYGDLKPDNVIHSGTRLKLIDFGGVRRMDDVESPIFFTPGYGAPELGTEGPSIGSDLYTVGRTLAVLSFEFAGYTTSYKETLPRQEDFPLLARFGSYYRFLQRATHHDPDRRFRSAEHMADQLAGVLREVRSLETGEPTPGVSTVFSPETHPFGELVTHNGVSSVLPPDASEIVSRLPTPLPDFSESDDDWTTEWYQGLSKLADGKPERATASFERVYAELPGETAPKLALAASAELAGDHSRAADYYDLVWRTDHSYLSAAFGLARMRHAQHDHEGAAAILRSLHLTVRGSSDDPGAPTRRPRKPRWQTFVEGVAESLIPVPRRRPRTRHRSGWEHINARLHTVYTELGPPATEGKDAQR